MRRKTNCLSLLHLKQLFFESIAVLWYTATSSYFFQSRQRSKSASPPLPPPPLTLLHFESNLRRRRKRRIRKEGPLEWSGCGKGRGGGDRGGAQKKGNSVGCIPGCTPQECHVRKGKSLSFGVLKMCLYDVVKSYHVQHVRMPCLPMSWEKGFSGALSLL